jgi:fatty acid desaturase
VRILHIINTAVTVLLFLIGVFIKYKKVTWLISGYNTSSKEKKEEYDIEKLCRYMGNFVMLLAVCWGIMTIFGFIFEQYIAQIMIIGTVVFTIVIVGGVIFLNTGGRVKK